MFFGRQGSQIFGQLQQGVVNVFDALSQVVVKLNSHDHPIDTQGDFTSELVGMVDHVDGIIDQLTHLDHGVIGGFVGRLRELAQGFDVAIGGLQGCGLLIARPGGLIEKGIGGGANLFSQGDGILRNHLKGCFHRRCACALDPGIGANDMEQQPGAFEAVTFAAEGIHQMNHLLEILAELGGFQLGRRGARLAAMDVSGDFLQNTALLAALKQPHGGRNFLLLMGGCQLNFLQIHAQIKKIIFRISHRAFQGRNQISPRMFHLGGLGLRLV